MKTVFVDVDTQLDFLLPAGSLYVPGSERIIPGLSRLASFAESHSVPLVSTVDAHAEDDVEFKSWPPHCVVDTVGQRKPFVTLLSRALVLPSTAMDFASLRSNATLSPQILVEKQHTDCFSNPNLKSLLDMLDADRYVVYGVVTEICVQQAVLGLLARGGRVDLVTDAVRSLDQGKADLLFKTVEDRGGALTTVAAVTT